MRIGLIVAAAAFLTITVISPALGGPPLKSLIAPLVKKDVAKALAEDGTVGATGPAGSAGAAGPPGAPGEPGAPGMVVTEGTPMGGTIASGTTLRGVFSPYMAQALPNATNAIGYGISFGGYELSTRPLVEVVGKGEKPTTNCPGTVASPAAASGYVCLYMAEVPSDATTTIQILDPSRGLASASGIDWKPETDVATSFGDGRVSRFGYSVSIENGVSNGVSMWGTWAVTG